MAAVFRASTIHAMRAGDQADSLRQRTCFGRSALMLDRGMVLKLVG
jgi:hypothetical protein